MWTCKNRGCRGPSENLKFKESREKSIQKSSLSHGFLTIELHVDGVVSSWHRRLRLDHPELVGFVSERTGCYHFAGIVAQLRLGDCVVLLVHHKEVTLKKMNFRAISF